MIKEAEEHAEEDKQIKERVEKLNQADSLVFSTKKQLDEYGDKISDDNKKAIEEAVENLEKAHKEENMDEIDAAIEAVNQAWSGASEEIYKATQEEAAAGGAAGAEGAGAQGQPASDDAEGGDDAVDADYEVVDDEDDKK